jgi:two-component system, NarL family, response regulator NreC
MTMIRILLVEDHNIVRNGIKTMLNAVDDIEVAAEYPSATEAIEELKKGLQVDLILTDINMPGMDGISFTTFVTANYPDIKVLILSMYDQDDYINRAFKKGASGYVLKNIGPEELIFGIRQIVLRDERYICSELSLRLLDRQLQASEIAIPDNIDFDFSSKEVEILRLVSEGFTNVEIAERLNTSKRTVEGHRQNLIDKTGVRNSIALIRFAIVNGLIT